MVARLDPDTRISEGENARLWADVRSLHVFDPATGQNLTLGDTGSPAAASGQADGGPAHGAATPSAAQPASEADSR